MMNYPCIYNEEGKCKLYSTVYEHSWCVEGPCEDQTLSNGDRIRSKSNKELAEFVVNIIELELRSGIMRSEVDLTETQIKAIKQRWFNALRDWLKQPVE